MRKSILSEAARAMNKARKTHGGGRPRSKGKRCPCDIMTIKRARARGYSREHAASCPFHPDQKNTSGQFDITALLGL